MYARWRACAVLLTGARTRALFSRGCRCSCSVAVAVLLAVEDACAPSDTLRGGRFADVVVFASKVGARVPFVRGLVPIEARVE